MTQGDTTSLIIIVFLLPFIIGVVLGCKEKIVVFRDYNDLFIVFLAAILFMPLLVSFSVIKSPIMFLFCIFIELSLALWVIHRTYQDNQGNLISTFLSLYTKIPLSLFFIFNLLSFLEYFSKPNIEQTEGFSFTPLLFLTPLILKLIKNKSGTEKYDVIRIYK